MPTGAALVPEFDQEMAKTRTVLERCPEDKYGWKPHEKSFDMISLATHIANMAEWGVLTLKRDSFDIAPEGGEPVREAPASSRDDLLQRLDKHTAAFRAALLEASDDDLAKPWSLLSGGQPLFTMPRAVIIRSMILNHTIHHRAQLTVYLRLNDVPVPAIYGPSADEPGGM